jgi:hypothetical protein
MLRCKVPKKYCWVSHTSYKSHPIITPKRHLLWSLRTSPRREHSASHLKKVEQFPVFNLGRPSKEIDQCHIRKSERKEDSPVAPDAAQPSRPKVEELEILITGRPLADLTVRCRVRVQKLGRRRKHPVSRIFTAGLARRWRENVEIGLGADDVLTTYYRCCHAPKKVGEGAEIVELDSRSA